MTKKKLCPLCNRRSPNRSCPVRGEEICSKCCGLNRASAGCEVNCDYYRPVTVRKEVNEALPVYKFEEYRYILGDMDDVKVEGSLYKCFKCGKGELSDDDVELIKEVTRHDVAAGVCGTMAETMVNFVCDECRKKDKTADERTINTFGH